MTLPGVPGAPSDLQAMPGDGPGLDNGTAYSFTAVATNAVGNRAISS